MDIWIYIYGYIVGAMMLSKRCAWVLSSNIYKWALNRASLLGYVPEILSGHNQTAWGTNQISKIKWMVGSEAQLD